MGTFTFFFSLIQIRSSICALHFWCSHEKDHPISVATMYLRYTELHSNRYMCVCHMSHICVPVTRVNVSHVQYLYVLYICPTYLCVFFDVSLNDDLLQRLSHIHSHHTFKIKIKIDHPLFVRWENFVRTCMYS